MVLKSDFTPDLAKLSARPFNEALTQLIYGPSGCGKTYYLGTAGPRNVIFNPGVGVTTLQSPAFLQRYPFDPWTIEIPDTARPFDYVCDSFEWLVKNKRDAFDSISLDDFSAMSRFAMRKAIEINKDLGKTTTFETAKKYGGIIAPQIADYGEEMSVLEWFLNEITVLAKAENFHLICTAHERITFGKPPKIGEPAPELKIRPGFTGQTFPDKIPAFFDEVWRMGVFGKGDNKKYQMTTQGNEKVQGKSRHGGVFPEIITDASFPQVVALIKSHKYIPDPDNPDLLIKVS